MKVFKQLFTLLAILVISCQAPPNFADTILINGNIYTVNEKAPNATALAIKNDRIVAIGSDDIIKNWEGEETEIIDLEGQFTMPGFIEGHGHFSGLGESLMNLNFLNASSWSEIVEMVAQKATKAKPGEWIIGRGWHQEKWLTPLEKQVLGYPYHDQLSALTPNNPVLLDHASGHAIFANAKAMELAGISAETPNPVGGEIVRDSRGNAIGVFEETAEKLINQVYQDYLATLSKEENEERWLKGIRLAEQESLENGITSFQDAGSTFEEVERYKALALNGQLNIRLWAMVREPYSKLKDNLGGFPITDIGSHFFTSKAIKVSIDGALGSFGAWLLQSYADKENFIGQNTTSVPEVKNMAQLAWEKDLQFCVHAIGDRANRTVLNIFEETFQQSETQQDHRWRIEHAQHLDTTDIPRFKKLGVIASMQGIHCTSDAPFVEKRLGSFRAQWGSYPWRSLLNAGVLIANGTDAPVEDISPIECFYASVTRKRQDTGFEFYPEQRMTREEAIFSYTLGNAYAAFEEKHKGSLEVGKLADLVVLSKDLLHCKDEEILHTKIVLTMVGGKVKFRS